MFVRFGTVMTPYHCAPVKRSIARLLVRPHPNPWSFEPCWSVRVLAELPRTRSCGGWHLTKKSADGSLMAFPFTDSARSPTTVTEP